MALLLCGCGCVLRLQRRVHGTKLRSIAARQSGGARSPSRPAFKAPAQRRSSAVRAPCNLRVGRAARARGGRPAPCGAALRAKRQGGPRAARAARAHGAGFWGPGTTPPEASVLHLYTRHGRKHRVGAGRLRAGPACSDHQALGQVDDIYGCMVTIAATGVRLQARPGLLPTMKRRRRRKSCTSSHRAAPSPPGHHRSVYQLLHCHLKLLLGAAIRGQRKSSAAAKKCRLRARWRAAAPPSRAHAAGEARRDSRPRCRSPPGASGRRAVSARSACATPAAFARPAANCAPRTTPLSQHRRHAHRGRARRDPLPQAGGLAQGGRGPAPRLCL